VHVTSSSIPNISASSPILDSSLDGDNEDENASLPTHPPLDLNQN